MGARAIALLLLILSFPLWVVIGVAIKLTSEGPIIFKHRRIGKGRKPFTLYKFRTMVEGAEQLKTRYLKLNEADGPVFKIRNDPRYTKIGRLLSHIGLDELPQLINVIKGEMAFVGPRPFPIDEAEKVPQKYEKRFSILPGVTSPWIIHGAHKLRFDEWMRLDIGYVNKKSLLYDAKIVFLTITLIIKWVILKIKNQI